MVALKKVELEIEVKAEDVIQKMGGGNLPNLEQRVAEAVQESLMLLKPQGIYKNFEIKSVGGIVEAQGLTINSKNVAELLKNSSQLSLFLVTIGPETEQRAQSSDALDALIFDTIGSIGVEAAANSINKIITDEAKTKGFKTTTRYSIGYGDWNISQQKDILQILGGKNLGVSLTESFIMVPQKSITAILGWYKEKKE